MNLYALPGGQPARASRTGTRWTDEDYERLVEMCREGRDLAELTEELCRTEQSVLDRARRMLPADERGLPRDRAVTRLQERFREDPGYDWSGAMLEGPPPRPVVHRVYRRTGIEGLHRQELLAVAEAVVLLEQVDDGLRAGVLRAVAQQGLEDELIQQVGRGAVRRARDADDECWVLEPPRTWAGHVPVDEEETYRPWCEPDCPEEVPRPEDEPETWW